MLAVAPQILLSITYATYNDHLACIMATREYGRFASAVKSKQLGVAEEEHGRLVNNKRAFRVSQHPRREQKSRPFLTLPIKYAVCLMDVSALLHWLISEALFLVHVDIVDQQGIPTAWSVRRVGILAQGILVLFVTGLLVGIVIGSIGLRKLKRGVPVASGCSASTSAACYPLVREGVADHLLKPESGVERQPPAEQHGDHDQDDIGRCTFTSEGTEPSMV